MLPDPAVLMAGPIKDLIWESSDEYRVERRLTRSAIYVLLATVVLVLGLNWPIMARGIRSITPIWMGAFRVMGASVVVIAVGAMSGNIRVPPRRDLPMIASLAVFRLAAVFMLVFTALTLVPEVALRSWSGLPRCGRRRSPRYSWASG